MLIISWKLNLGLQELTEGNILVIGKTASE